MGYLIDKNRLHAATARGQMMVAAANAAPLPPNPGDAYRDCTDARLGRDLGLQLILGAEDAGHSRFHVLRGLGQAIGEVLRQNSSESAVRYTPVILEEIGEGIDEGLTAEWR